MTDFQQARAALGARLRELRTSRPGGRLTGTQLAERLGWTQSKVSKLERGRQTATVEDLQRWAEGTDQPEVFGELRALLHGIESHHRSWRRQLASGHRAVQENLNVQHAQSTVFHAWQNAMIVGVLQTPDYARHIFSCYADLHRSPKDIEDAVRARMQRQQGIYDHRRKYHILMWEAALYSLVCPPPVLVGQLDRLTGAIGMDTVKLGIVPLSAPVKIPPASGFLIHDERLAVVETWHAELWIEDADSVATYLRTWQTLQKSAVYGADAHRIINRARHSISPR
ncbi:helix-turn-helix domain-containing protein [Streptomyces piniterrae]|uniref:Helix-turn-helix domain-containing protein n=1 Tax=Streptomyces piniterrae TaxID=2571125 RepID=A0A4U0NG52_9ACTN|nr:helix-turn-helix transcriptional regulator [Streptomyces piniterrae]TJZ52913.1 helix-turn-helix domain-containing protein [Streptomyces piniterrae]